MPTPIEMPKIPNLEKLRRVQDGFSSIMEFLEWAEGEGFISIRGSRPERMVYKFYGLDEKLIEQERVALLDYQRALNAQGIP